MLRMRRLSIYKRQVKAAAVNLVARMHEALTQEDPVLQPLAPLIIDRLPNHNKAEKYFQTYKGQT